MENYEKLTGPSWFVELETKRIERISKMTEKEKEELRETADRMADKAESSIGINT